MSSTSWGGVERPRQLEVQDAGWEAREHHDRLARLGFLEAEVCQLAVRCQLAYVPAEFQTTLCMQVAGQTTAEEADTVAKPDLTGRFVLEHLLSCYYCTGSGECSQARLHAPRKLTRSTRGQTQPESLW